MIKFLCRIHILYVSLYYKVATLILITTRKFFRDLKRTRKEVKKMIRKKMLRKNTIKTYGDADYLIVSWWKNKN